MILELRSALTSVADPARADAMSAYLRGQFPFLGINTPLRRAATKELLHRLNQAPNWEFVFHCWEQPEREFHYVACDHLRKVPLQLSDLPRLQELVSTKSWWDTIDPLARPIGKASDAGTMYQWAHDNDLWVRRVAIIHQLGWRGDTNLDLLSTIILANLGSNEFFINKAIGWALRDYARHDPSWVRKFLATHAAQLSALSRREAAKHL